MEIVEVMDTVTVVLCRHWVYSAVASTAVNSRWSSDITSIYRCASVTVTVALLSADVCCLFNLTCDCTAFVQ